jgi:uncharacterized membrane protein
MTTPYWALSLAYALHMSASVLWIGGLAVFTLIVLPAARRSLDPEMYTAFLADIVRRFDPLGWFCLVLLAGTGMFQMSANPNYQGFLSIEGRWSVAIFVKHLLFLVMIAVSAFITWGVLPKMRRLALLQTGVEGSEKSVEFSARAGGLRRQETTLLRLNLVLGALIIVLTALARAV